MGRTPARLINARGPQQVPLMLSQPIIIPLRFDSQTFEFHELLRVHFAHKFVVKSRRPSGLIENKTEIDRSEVGIEITGCRVVLLRDLQQIVPKKERKTVNSDLQQKRICERSEEGSAQHPLERFAC